jgi:hypothetical protein
MRSIDRQVRQVIAENDRLRGRTALLDRLSSALTVFGMFTMVIGVASTTDIGLFVVSAMPLLAGAVTAVWARLLRRRFAFNETRIQSTLSEFNERTGYPESSFIWPNERGRWPHRPVAQAEGASG